MRPTTAALAVAALATGSSAENYLGFNSGATLADRSAKFKKDFLSEFKTAQGLEGAPGTFNAVRLYTNIQAYSQDTPIEAFEAAIETKTKMLLGIWTSGTDNIDKELSALKKAVEQHGSKFTDLVIGMSIGSEDLYRISETGLKNDPKGVGAGPDVLVKFIKEYKETFANTPLAKVPIGHVDTWDVWGNATNKPVIDAVDFLGVDEYPYYETGKGNSIDNAGKLFKRAYDATVAAAGGKAVWVTETGWPSVGPDWDEAVTSTKNARKYWVDIGCKQLFNKVPTFWYNLRDSNPDNKMKFAITENLSTKPIFDLSCPANSESSSSTLATKPASKTASGSKETSTGSGSDKSGDSKTSDSKAEPTGTPGSGSGSGSASTPTGGSGSGSGSGSASPTGGAPGASGSEPATVPKSGATSISALKGMTYAGLALVAGAFALL